MPDQETSGEREDGRVKTSVLPGTWGAPAGGTYLWQPDHGLRFSLVFPLAGMGCGAFVGP